LLVFEELAGLVPGHLLKEGTTTLGAELIKPEPLALLSQVAADRAAACLSLSADDIHVDAHEPQVASVGLPFLVVQLASRDALRRCVPDLVAFKGLMPIDGAVSIYAYTRDAANAAGRTALMTTMNPSG